MPDIEENFSRPETGPQSEVIFPPETPVAVPEEKTEPKKKTGGFFSFLFELAIILLSVWLIRTFLATPFQIEGDSMKDTLYNKEKIFVSKLPMYFGEIERGDIVVFKPPFYKMIPKSGPICYLKQRLFGGIDLRQLCGEEPQQYVKRVIGISGDTVEVKGGKVYLTPKDGERQELPEPYLNAENRGKTCFARNSCNDPKDRTGQTFVVPEGKVLVFGDNRNHSSDSRSAFEPGSTFHGETPEPFVPLENITGEAKLTIWPIERWHWFSS